MPEGHTLHRLARLHQRRFARAPVAVSSPQDRFASSTVDGRVLLRANAWGKHLFHYYEPARGGPIVHVHLGLYGAFREWRVPSGGEALPEPVGQVRMRMVGADYGTDLRGPTVCEVIDEAQVSDILARLGPDPLRSDADPSWARGRIAKSRRPIGALLMDQSVIAGVGNVYRSELLFRHRIDPYRPGRAIGEAEFDGVWTDLVDLMKVGLRRGKIITVPAEHDHGPPSYLPGRPRTYVYRRAGEPCRVCGGPISTAVLEGRNVFWCAACQE
jgi:endonuclease-8